MSVSSDPAPANNRFPTAALQAMDAAHHLHPFTDHKALSAEGSRVIVKAEGSTLTDSEGNRILDGMSGLWCVNVGYGRDRLAEAAYAQMKELPYYNAFFKTTTEPAARLSEKLSEITPEGLERVFFANSGSEAVDTMIRLFRHFWLLEGKPEKQVLIGRMYGYHGSTMAAASLCGMSAMHAQAHLPLPGFEHVMQPDHYHLGLDGESAADFGLRAAKAFEDRILAIGPERVAAVVAEPIQGAGGVIIPPETYFPEVQRICRKHDVLLVADEVICGFGRTGQWWGSDTFGISPDLMTMAKGLSSGYLPISALMVGARVSKTLVEEGGEFFHGFTYSGHPVACAVALENIAIMEEEGLVERAGHEIGPYLQDGLRSLADHRIVGEVRGVGMIGAVELIRDKDGPVFFEPEGDVGTRCRDHCFANGLVMRAVRDVMVIAPPLVATRTEVDQMIDRARRAFDATALDLGL